MPSRDAFPRAILDRLGTWCAQHVSPAPAALVDVTLATAGRSNVTAIVTDAEGRRLVVRRPPFGEHAATAHDVLREGRIVRALGATEVPVAPVIGLCDDREVIGAPFFVMEFVDGATLDTPADAGALSGDDRRSLGLDLARCLAALHRIDPGAVGLGELGRPTGFVARQLSRFAKQWRGHPAASVTAEFSAVHLLLERRMPADAEPTRIVHGDYRIGNVLASAGRVAAVLDWELTTLGHPASDVAYMLNNWIEPGAGEEAPIRSPIEAGGFPTADEVLAEYRCAGGHPIDGPTLAFFRAFSYWRLASIRSGVAERLMGSSDPSVQAKAVQSRESVPRLLAASAAVLG